MDGQLPAIPFLETYALEVKEAGERTMTFAAPCAEQFSNPGNIMHGGFYCAVAGAAVDALVANLTVAGHVRWLEYKINLFRPMLFGAAARIEAEVVHQGRRSIVVRSEVFDEQRKRVALMVSTLGVSEERDPGLEWIEPSRAAEAAVTTPDRPPASPSRFFQTHGVEVTETRPGFAQVTAPYNAAFTAADGSLHPCFLGGVADCAAGPGSGTVAAADEMVSTIEYKVNLFAPVYEGPVTADGTVIAFDRGTAVMRIDVTDARGAVAAVMFTTLARVPRPAGLTA